MYQLVVVDDEYTIRAGMCNYIDWEAMGFQVAADFEDGKETIEYLKSHKVDVILTDIEMAEISGLELAKFVHENQLDCKVVILSGYKEFEYARKAIEYNVEHYILKPIRMDELQKVFGNMKEKLDECARAQEQIKGREQEFKEILPELQEQFWVGLLVGGLRSKDNIIRKRELLSLDFSTRTPCAIVNVSLEINPDANQMYYQQRDNRYNLLNNIFGTHNQGLSYHSVYLSADILKVIVTTREMCGIKDFEDRLRAQLEEKKQAVAMLLTLDMEAEIEACFPTITDLAEYKYSLQMHAQEKNAEKIRLVQEDYDRLQQKYRFLMETISDGDFEQLEALVENLLFEFRGFPPEQVKQLMVDMFSMLSHKLMKMSGALWQDVKEVMDYQKIMEAQDKKTMKEVCLAMLKQVIEIMGNRQNEVSRSIIDKASGYMKKNYASSLSLEMLADHYYLNPTYFSRMFRQYMGVTFTDYLIEIRMEKAKELLGQGKYKVYEVSRKVGYSSEKYFCRVFKQFTGQSPTEYSRSSKDN